jgi:hypothetical protein
MLQSVVSFDTNALSISFVCNNNNNNNNSIIIYLYGNLAAQMPITNWARINKKKQTYINRIQKTNQFIAFEYYYYYY